MTHLPDEPTIRARAIRDLFLAQKQATYEGTRGVFARIPPDHLDWHPAAGMLSLGEIVRHCWASEEGTRRLALDADWSYHERRVPQGLAPFLADVVSLDAELARFDAAHLETMRAVEAFPVDRWDEKRAHEALGIRRRVSVILFGIIEHQVHHRAQVAIHVRLLTGERASPYQG